MMRAHHKNDFNVLLAVITKGIIWNIFNNNWLIKWDWLWLRNYVALGCDKTFWKWEKCFKVFRAWEIVFVFQFPSNTKSSLQPPTWITWQISDSEAGRVRQRSKSTSRFRGKCYDFLQTKLRKIDRHAKKVT